MTVWDKFPDTLKNIECMWCHGAKEIDPDAWVPYQPHQQRPKRFCDITLRDGTVMENCYPNGDAFFPSGKQQPGVKFVRRVADYRVTHVRVTRQEILDEQEADKQK